MIETEDARPEDNAKDYDIDPKQVSGKLKKILNEILNEMKSSHEWGEWGAWGDCCTGNLELKKGGGLRYSDNPEAVQVRLRYGVTTGYTFSGNAGDPRLVISKIVPIRTVRSQRMRDAILVT